MYEETTLNIRRRDQCAYGHHTLLLLLLLLFCDVVNDNDDDDDGRRKREGKKNFIQTFNLIIYKHFF